MATIRRIWTVMTIAIMLAIFGVIGVALFQAGAFDPPTYRIAPFSNPEPGRNVYDTAGIWSPATESQAQAYAQAIETRTGAQLIVYSEITDGTITLEEAKARGAALGNQWGVGRAGFEDGYVVLFDIEPNRLHGHVAMVGGSGFQAAFIPDEESTKIFEERMLPHLAGGLANYDGALLAGLARVNQLATPEQAAALALGRQVNAVLGLVGAPVAFLVLSGWAVLYWRRFGKDPVYLDDPSIHLPAPPAQLTAASGATIWEGKVTRRSLTAALLDLASRGEIGFVERKKFLGFGQKVGLLSSGREAADAVEAANRGRNARRPVSAAEQYALGELRKIGWTVGGDGDSIEGELGETELLEFGTKTKGFNERLEGHVVRQGWFREPPSAATGRWVARGVVELIVGAIAFFIALDVPSSGMTLIAVGVAGAGVLTLAISPLMPAVTVAGSMIRAMLAAYRRTLQKTMDQARSMQQVVDEAHIDWLETPDQAMVWGVALGLDSEVGRVLERSADDLQAGRATATSTWLPTWYSSADGGSFSSGGPSGSVFSGSAVPNIGSMVSAIGTIGTPPSSSGSGGGGGGGGGGFSGGGGGSF